MFSNERNRKVSAAEKLTFSNKLAVDFWRLVELR
jgi:hypothetical protein